MSKHQARRRSNQQIPRWASLLMMVGLRHPRHRRAATIRRWRLAWMGSALGTAALVIAAMALVNGNHDGGDLLVGAGGSRVGAMVTQVVHASPAAPPTSAATASSDSASIAVPASAAATATPFTVDPRPAAITLAFAGDLLPHGPMDSAAARIGATEGLPYDFAPMLAPLRPILEGVDLPICHFEVPVAPTRAQTSSYPVFGAPAELVAGAREAGYKGCSTVSNHALDKGLAGVRATLDTFDINRLGHAGSARSAEEAATPMIYDVRGVRVAHLAYAYGFNGFSPPADAQWAVNSIDPDRIMADAKAARSAGADLVVVSLHWGTEGVEAPNALQRRVAPILAADPDIDLIIGHHAHRVQPVNLVDGKFVAYGLGNELSNQHAATQRDGLLVVVTVQRTADGRYHPTGMLGVPTWMDTPNWRVLPIGPTLADPATPPALRSQLRASYERTVSAATSDGPVFGLRFEPLPA